MPWIEAGDHYATPPKPGPAAKKATGSLPADSPVEVVDGWAEIHRCHLVDDTIDVTGAETVEISDSSISRCRVIADPTAIVRIRNSRIDDSDLSRLMFDVLSRSSIVGCKLTGAEVIGRVNDVSFERCSLTLARFVGATMERIAFVDTVCRDVDLFESKLSDVSFDGCELANLNLDRATFERVDLRHATSIELTAIGNLAGCLITPIQAHSMALDLANALGLGIERDPDT